INFAAPVGMVTFKMAAFIDNFTFFQQFFSINSYDAANNLLETKSGPLFTAAQTIEFTVPNISRIDIQVNGSGGTGTAGCLDDLGYGPNNLSDNCGVSSFSVNQTNFDCSHVGSNPVTLTVNDVNGNTTNCNFNVTIIDPEAPTVSCSDVTFVLNENGTAQVGYAVGPVAGLLPAQNNPISFNGSCDCPTGWVATGYEVGAGCISDNFKLICSELLVDGTFGSTTQLTCASGQSDFPATAYPLSGGALVGFTVRDVDFANQRTHLNFQGFGKTISEIAMGNDNSSGNIIGVQAGGSGGCGETNLASSTQYAPNGHVIVGFDFVNTFFSSSIAFRYAPLTFNDLGISVSDNCGIATTVVSPTFFTCSNVGLNVVNVVVTDVYGNSSTCNSNVTIVDNTPPSLVCNDFTVNLDASGNAPVLISNLCSGLTDNCGISLAIISKPQFTCSDIGNNPVTVTLTDVNGNSSVSTPIVTVQDLIPPSVVCQDLTVVLDDNGMASIAAADVDAGSTDACGIASMSIDTNSFTCSDIGVNSVMLMVTDSSGNSASCSANVTIQDNQGPTISNCPADIVQNYDLGVCEAAVTWSVPTASDNCSNVQVSSSASPGATFPIGTTAVVYTFTDIIGNSTICSFNVTVNDPDPPSIDACPSNIVMNNDLDRCGAVVIYPTPTGSDLCGLQVGAFSAPISGFNGPFFFGGNSYYLSQSMENFATANALATNLGGHLVTITSQAENDFVAGLSPDRIMIGLNDIAVENDFVWTNGEPLGYTNWYPGEPNDFGGGEDAVEINLFTPGAWNDMSVNSPKRFVVEFQGQIGPSQTAGLPSGFEFPVGTTTNTFVFKDNSGNTSVCSFDVTVSDNQAPVVDNCFGGTAFFFTDPGQCQATIPIFSPPTATDNCGIVSMTGDLNPGDQLPIGLNPISYSWTDAAGNNSVCTFDVLVIDFEAPIISASPGGPAKDSTVTVTAPDGLCQAAVDWIEPSATDNCEVTSIISDYQPLATFPVGPTLVTYTAQDSSGNTATFSFTIEVLPGSGANCSGNLTVNAKVILEGPFNGVDMDDDLRDGDQIPLNSPYGGLESVNPSVLANDNQVVDWINLSLRNDPDTSTVGEAILATRAGLLLRDGRIVDVDGISPVAFNNVPSGNYYVVVEHRNHLGLSTANPVPVSSVTPLIDFTDFATLTYGGNFDGQNIGGLRVMIGGDVDNDSQISATDRNAVWNARNTAGYLNEDINMDIVVTAADRVFPVNNAFFGALLP
ncbi:MAG: HYR domain-containing protein, partial [Bacteroidota bacterium]